MNAKTISVIVIMMVVLILAGCIAENYWPANIDPLGKKYVGEDPNKIGFLPIGKSASNLAEARILRNKIEQRHYKTQFELEMEIKADNADYKLTAQTSDYNIKSSEASFNEIFGSFSQPGWLGAGLVSLLTFYTTKLYKDATMYSEQEVKDKTATATKV